MSWQPLLHGDLAERARETVRAIAEDIPRHMPPPPQPGLPGGDAGFAVFYAYFTRAGGDGAETADRCLERAVDAVADVPLPPYLHGGFPGIAWAVEHLWRPAADDDDANAEIDEALLDLVSRSPWIDSYDLILGLVGLGVYALERRPRPSAERILDEIVARLDELAEPAPAGITLWTPPEQLIPETRVQHPDGYYNLGMAHGVPAVIGLLGSIAGERSQRLREGLTAWIQSVRHPAPDGSLYAYSLDKRAPKPNAGCRAAWCYGDPGVAMALLRGARAAGDAALEELALDVGRAAAARPVDRAGAVDAGLCHGAAGLLHIFNRLHQATDEPVFRDAAVRWAEKTLAMRGDGVGGYRAYMPTSDEPWQLDPGFLTGAAGIALALLAATTDIEPRWDITLLCDVPPR